MMQTISTQSLGKQQTSDFDYGAESDSTLSSQFGEFLTEAASKQAEPSKKHTQANSQHSDSQDKIGQDKISQEAPVVSDNESGLDESLLLANQEETVSVEQPNENAQIQTSASALLQPSSNLAGVMNTAITTGEKLTEIPSDTDFANVLGDKVIAPEKALYPNIIQGKLVLPDTPQIHPEKPNDLIEIDIIPPDFISDDLTAKPVRDPSGLIEPQAALANAGKSPKTTENTANQLSTVLDNVTPDNELIPQSSKATTQSSEAATEIQKFVRGQGVSTDDVLAKKSILAEMIATSQEAKTSVETNTATTKEVVTNLNSLVKNQESTMASSQVIAAQSKNDNASVSKSQLVSDFLADLKATTSAQLSVTVKSEENTKVSEQTSLNITPELATSKIKVSDDTLKQLSLHIAELDAKLANMSDLEKQGALKVALPLLEQLAVTDPELATKLSELKEKLAKLEANLDSKLSPLEKNVATLPVIDNGNKNPQPNGKVTASKMQDVKVANTEQNELASDVEVTDLLQEHKVADNKLGQSTVVPQRPVQSFTGLVNQISELVSTEAAKAASEQAVDLQRTETASTVHRHNAEQGKLAQVLDQAVNISKSDAAKALYSKTAMLVALGKQEAEIRLDPPELGSMQIRIRSDAEQAQLNFVVQNQQAKEMLEQSMGRLREMLAQSGITLGDASVEQGPNHGGEQNSQQQSSFAASNSQSNDADTSEIVQKSISRADGIDFYA